VAAPAPRLPVLAAALALAVLAGSTLLAPTGVAQGACPADPALGITPLRFDVPSAQPGQSYVGDVQVQSTYQDAKTVQVNTSGAAAPWVTTDPAGSFTVDGCSGGTVHVRHVQVTVEVPVAAGPGSRLAYVAFTTDVGTGASGSPVRAGAALTVNVTVGGTAVVRLEWSGGSAADTDSEHVPTGGATASNTGNVATTATLSADVVRQGATTPLANATASLRVDPGDSVPVNVTFDRPLPEGQYTMRFHADGNGPPFSAGAAFKVTAPGTLAPAGVLLVLDHAPYGTVGLPLRIDARFRNTGTLAIRAAQLKAEVHRADGTLLAPLASDALAVPTGASVNLTVYWTPPAAGTYTLTGHVLYDGYTTPDQPGPLNVRPAASGAAGFAVPWWLWLLLAVLVVGGLVAWLSTRRRQRPPGTSKPPPMRRSDPEMARTLRRR